MDFLTLLDYLIRGLSLGSIYAIIALGYTMVYGIAKMLNFAHGDVIMVGAYACFFTVTGMSPMFEEGSVAAMVVPALAGVVLSMVVCTALGVVIEGLAYKPLRQAPSLAVLITAIGVSYFLQNAALLLWSSSPKIFSPIVGSGQLQVGPLNISYVTLVTIVACIVIMVCLTLFTGKTKMGKAMRACSEDKGAAQLMGINVDRIISLVFFIGPGLGGAAGLMVGIYYGQIDFTMGWSYGLKAFTAAILGGIGNIPGAMIGGLLLGVIEALAAGYIAIAWKDAIAFTVLILILIIRPTGILGERTADKL